MLSRDRRETIVMLGMALILFTPRLFSGESDGVSYKFQYYGDNNDVDVFSNTVTAGKQLGSKTHVSVSYLVDAITGASRKDIRSTMQGVDGITGASAVKPDGITGASPTAERRHQVSATLSFVNDFIKWLRKDQNNDDPTTFSVTGINSTESDYTSRTISAAVSQDLFQRNTTLGALVSRGFDQYQPVSRFTPSSSDEGWNFFGDGRRLTDRLSLSLTQGITTTTVASVIWGYAYDRGYLARPYYVYEIGDTLYREHLPPRHRSMTVTGRLNQYLPVGGGMSLHLDYRYYADSWELISHTISAELYTRIGENFIIRPSYRFYTQSDAFFYADVYPKSQRYMTTDFKYRHGITHSAGLKLSWELRDVIKPTDSPFFALFPVEADIAGDLYMRTGPHDVALRNSHYNYWDIDKGFRSFWIQSGLRFAF
jgi:hypothetical protein